MCLTISEFPINVPTSKASVIWGGLNTKNIPNMLMAIIYILLENYFYKTREANMKSTVYEIILYNILMNCNIFET